MKEENKVLQKELSHKLKQIFIKYNHNLNKISNHNYFNGGLNKFCLTSCGVTTPTAEKIHPSNMYSFIDENKVNKSKIKIKEFNN